MIQEFFHSRVDSYLKKIGFHVFGIKHYWARFEFAKSRGQIHLHLLGIIPNASKPDEIYEQLYKMKHNKDVQGTMLGEWARNTFNMTAECESVDDIPDESKYSPCKTRLSQVQSLEIDQQLLCNFCQIHECNGFCLRSVKIPKQANNEERVSVSN